MVKLFAFFILMVSSTTAGSSFKKEEIKKQYFKYYDLISLKGESPIEPGKNLTYPYVSIDSSGKNTTITHFISERDFFSSTYTQRSNYQERKIYDSKQPGEIRFREFIRNDSIITLSYEVETDNRIAAIGIYQNNVFVSYGLSEFLKGDISPDIAVDHAKKMKSGLLKRIEFSQKNENVFVSYESKYINDPHVLYSNSFAFKNNNEALQWWLIFKWKSYLRSIFSSRENLISLGVDKKEL